MKRSAAMLLAALVMLGAFAMSFAAFAEDTRVPLNDPRCVFCGKKHTLYDDETGTIGLFSCICCLQCDYLDGTALTKCARNEEGHYIGSRDKMCCNACTGFFPCLCTEGDSTCTCVYCGRQSQVNEQVPVDIVPEKATNIFSTVLQTVTSKLTDVFTRLFEIIFAIFGV